MSHLSAKFQGLSDAQRAEIVAMLRQTDLSCEEIAERCKTSSVTVNRIRRQAGVAKRKRRHPMTQERHE